MPTSWSLMNSYMYKRLCHKVCTEMPEKICRSCFSTLNTLFCTIYQDRSLFVSICVLLHLFNDDFYFLSTCLIIFLMVLAFQQFLDPLKKCIFPPWTWREKDDFVAVMSMKINFTHLSLECLCIGISWNIILNV